MEAETGAGRIKLKVSNVPILISKTKYLGNFRDC